MEESSERESRRGREGKGGERGGRRGEERLEFSPRGHRPFNARPALVIVTQRLILTN